MQKKFEHKESRGLPGGPNEMFTYVTGVFDIYQAPSNIEGQGMFAGKSFKKGDLIGLAHSNGQPVSELGRMHNHDENSPTMISKKSGGDRFVFAAKDLQPGDELTTNYRMQPELEQPEDFQYGGQLGLDPEMLYKNKYNTELTASEKKEFDKWVAEESKRQGRDILMDMGAYDIQGFWKAGDHKRMDQDNHGTDAWKKPNHPTFSNQSNYHGVDGFYGGNWKKDGGYQPSKQTLQMYDPNYYEWMFGTEPNRPEYLDMSRYESGINLPTPLYYQEGGKTPSATSNIYPVNAQGIPMDTLDEVTVTGDRFKEKWWSPANLGTFGLMNEAKRRLTKNINPFGYDGLNKITDALFYPNKKIDLFGEEEKYPDLAGKTEAELKRERIQRQNSRYGTSSPLLERQQLFQYMMGQDASQYDGVPLSGEGYGLRTSKYKPTKASDPNAHYFSSPATEQEIKNEIQEIANNPKENIFVGLSDYTKGSVLGRYNLTKGEDDKGKYVSYYDIWDLDPFKNGSLDYMYTIPSEIPLIGDMEVSQNTLHNLSNKFQQLGNVNPAELYGRVYYTENPDGTVDVLDEKKYGGGALDKYQTKGETPLTRDEIFNIPRSVRYEDGNMVLQDKPIWDGMLDEVTITPTTSSEIAWQENRADQATGGLDPIYPVFELLSMGTGTAYRSGAGALARNTGKKQTMKLADHFIPIHNKGAKAYAKSMKAPPGANMNIADDVWSGGSLYGKGDAFQRQEALDRIANFQKDLSPVPFTHAHGTGANALEGIFKNKGLRPSSELQKSGDLLTGEMLRKQSAAPHFFKSGQSTVSTASIGNPRAAAQYALDYGKGAGNYPVVFGINPRVGAQSRMSIPFNSTVQGETLFRNGIGFDEISNIFVPDAQKAAFIQKYGDQLGNIKLGSFDDYVNQAKALSGRRKITGAEDYLYEKGGSLPKAQLGGMFIGGPGLTIPISQAVGAPGSNLFSGFPVPNQGLRTVAPTDNISTDGGFDAYKERVVNAENQTNLDKAYNFATQWMSSPRYKEMLNKSGGTDWWTTSYDIAEERINNLNKIQSAPLYIEDDPNQKFSQDQLLGLNGYSDNSDGSVYVQPFYGAKKNGTLYDHEISHSIDRPIDNSLPKDFVKYWGRGMGFEPRLIPDSDVNLITNLVDHSIPQEYSISTWDQYGDTPEEGTRNYFAKPTEVRARLNEIRRKLNDKGVDVFNNEITPSDFDKVIKNQAVEDLRGVYSDEDILRLLNTISSVNDNAGAMPYAQKGGEAPNGSNLYPVNAEGIPMDMLDEIVVKPSKFQTWFNKFRNLQEDYPIIEHFTNPFIAVDNALQVSQIPSNFVRESIEGIEGKGDGEFNWGNIVPDIGGTTILDDTEAQVPISRILGVEDPKAAVGVDILTDPLTYVGGAGIGKNILQKVGRRVAPKIIKPITTIGKLDNLPQYVKDVPVGNSDLIMTHAMPGLVPKMKGTKDGVLIAHAIGPRNNHMTLKKFLDAATGQDYYSFTESFIDNPMLAGRAFKMAEDLVPKGSILKQAPNGTLSQDSFNLMTRRLGDTRRFRDLTNYDADYINLNEFAKGRNRLGRDAFTFSQSDLNALNAQYMDIFNNLGISEFRGLGSRQVPVMNLGNKGYNMFEIPGLQNITDPRALEKYYNVSVPNITLQKLYQKGGEKTSWLDYGNPFNWGVYTYDDAGTFGEAFAKAREEGQDQFMYYGDRYTTELAPTPEVKEEPKEDKLFYNKDILKGLSEEQVARRQSLLNAANTVASTQGDNDNLRRLLVMSAVMENTLGANPKAYGRDYTRSPMSIDDIAYDDLFNIREGATDYTAQQKKNAAWLEGLGINTSDVDSLLKADDPMASMAVARLVYGRVTEALPSGDDPDALYNYYLEHYNKGGLDKYGGPEAHRKKFNDYYDQIYREFGGETDELKIYKDYVYGVYDGTEMQSKAEKIYDKLNRVYYKEAKQSGTTVPNYILSKVMKQSDN